MEYKKGNTEQESLLAGDSEELGVELRSEEFQEVLSRIPSWLLRWGIMLIFVLLAILFIGNYFFRYPEIITAPIVVTTKNLPVNVVAKLSGRIDTLYVIEKQQVVKNQILGVLENPTSTPEILALIAFTDTFNIQKNTILTFPFADKTLKFSQEMTGTVEIITEDLSLLQRLLDLIKALLIK